ncbi:MAG: RNA-binding protein [Bdellovibrionales bacterium]|jgi:cold-inducible RNA-binding protein|nr:RNA-binding protein [Bdellovibrionales bacterium]
MKNKLYVGNLSYQMSESDLEAAFGNFGTVQSARIITDRDTGRSKGFGFVEMENDDQAQECIENLDGKELSGRNIRVNIAQDKRTNKPGRF